MKCPYCNHHDDRVIDSRASGDGGAIRRRRECQLCTKRYTTYERVEETPRLVIKKDRRREPFSRDKVLAGLLRACEKRPIPLSRLEQVVDRIERKAYLTFDREVETRHVGELVVEELKAIDKVAYIRFASVYQEYADVSQFLRVLAPLVNDGEEYGAPEGDPGAPATQERPASRDSGGEPLAERGRLPETGEPENRQPDIGPSGVGQRIGAGARRPGSIVSEERGGGEHPSPHTG